MKYFNITALQATISRIREGNITHEHRTGSAALGLTRHYFPVDSFVITPEQIQEVTCKKPDLAIEKFISSSSTFIPHCFVEVKSIINSSINNIPDQLFATIRVTIDDFGFINDNFSTFMIAMKGTKIAFYVYHSFSSLLDDYNIFNYKGFIPLNYVIPEENFLVYHKDYVLNYQAYEYYKIGLNFETDADKLRDLGVESTQRIPHPHIFDLLNEKHYDHIHNMFKYFAKEKPNRIFRS